MKVTPSLFPPNTPAPRQTAEASEARRAFEAMLSASAARTRAIQSPTFAQDGTLTNSGRQAARIETKEPDSGPMPLSRPGRVLDIKV
jgi:hypothetical protein